MSHVYMHTEEFVRNLLKVDRDTISKWRYRFPEFLSSSAKHKGQTRYYTETDIRVLALINEYWEEDPDYENICAKLYSKQYDDEKYFELVYLNTSVFNEILSENFSESYSHVMLDSGGMSDPIEVARAYKYAGDTLIKEASSYSETPYFLVHPIFYTYRHATELSLKIIIAYEHIPKDKTPHSLSKLIKRLKILYKARLNPWVQEFLDKFDEVDKKGTSFRYAGAMPAHIIEWEVNLRQLQVAVEFLCREFENLIRKSQNGSVR